MATTTQCRMVFTIANGKTPSPAFYIADGAAAIAFGTLGAIAQAIYDTVASSGLMAHFTNAVSFDRAEVQNFTIDPTPDPPTYPDGRLVALTTEVVSVGAPILGSDAGISEVPQNAVVYSFATATPGKSGRGRMYLPPVSENDTTSAGVIDSGLVSGIQTDMGAVIAAAVTAAGGAAAHVVVSRKDNVNRPVVTKVVKNIVRTQRRRASRG